MNDQSGQRWWLALDGKAEGPYAKEYILSLLGQKQVALTTPACVAGATDWQPLASWPIFAVAGPTSAPPPLPPPFLPTSPNPSAFAGAAEPVLTNPLLPQMANWICIYCIAVSPILWFVQHMSCVVTGMSGSDDPDLATIGLVFDILNALKSLAATILLAIGGMRLKRLRASGATLIRASLWFALIGGAIVVALYFVGAGIATANSDSATAGTEQNPAAELLTFGLVVLGFGEMLFMAVALVWLTRHERELPLIAGT